MSLSAPCHGVHSPQVVVTMAETYWTSAGKRLTNIAINGVQSGQNIDAFAATNGQFLPKVYSYTATASAAFGGIQVTFTATADQPSVAALEVYELNNTSTPSL